MSTTLQVQEIDRPEFTVAVRGYDRAQVDDYVGRALEWLTELQARVDESESRARAMAAELHNLRRARDELAEQSGLPSPRSITAFGERLSSVLQAGVDAAEQLRMDGAHEAAERRAQLSEECRRMVERASEEAEQILSRSRDKEREMDLQLADLTARRAATMADLGKLQEQLTSFLSQGQPAPAESQPTAGPFEDVDDAEDAEDAEDESPYAGVGGGEGDLGRDDDREDDLFGEVFVDGDAGGHERLGADATAAVPTTSDGSRHTPVHGRTAATEDPTRTLIARTVSPSPRRRG